MSGLGPGDPAPSRRGACGDPGAKHSTDSADTELQMCAGACGGGCNTPSLSWPLAERPSETEPCPSFLVWKAACSWRAAMWRTTKLRKGKDLSGAHSSHTQVPPALCALGMQQGPCMPLRALVRGTRRWSQGAWRSSLCPAASRKPRFLTTELTWKLLTLPQSLCCLHVCPFSMLSDYGCGG